MILDFKGWTRLNEQSEEAKRTMQVQRFLNKKGITDQAGQRLKEDGLAGKSTEEAITKYQAQLGVWPTDGVWGPDTVDAMRKKSPKDAELFDDQLGFFEKWF
jgi:peptidoglycan hydrolase-like protein with peptidoglycan-binding domain